MSPTHEVIAEGSFCPQARSQTIFQTTKGIFYLQLQGKNKIKRLRLRSTGMSDGRTFKSSSLSD